MFSSSDISQNEAPFLAGQIRMFLFERSTNDVFVKFYGSFSNLFFRNKLACIISCRDNRWRGCWRCHAGVRKCFERVRLNVAGFTCISDKDGVDGIALEAGKSWQHSDMVTQSAETQRRKRLWRRTTSHISWTTTRHQIEQHWYKHRYNTNTVVQNRSGLLAMGVNVFPEVSVVLPWISALKTCHITTITAQWYFLILKPTF